MGRKGGQESPGGCAVRAQEISQRSAPPYRVPRVGQEHWLQPQRQDRHQLPGDPHEVIYPLYAQHPTHNLSPYIVPRVSHTRVPRPLVVTLPTFPEPVRRRRQGTAAERPPRKKTNIAHTLRIQKPLTRSH